MRYASAVLHDGSMSRRVLNNLRVRPYVWMGLGLTMHVESAQPQARLHAQSYGGPQCSEGDSCNPQLRGTHLLGWCEINKSWCL